MLLASAVNSARIALDQSVIYRRVHDGLEQPVRLSDCDRPDTGVEKLLTPFPHDALFDIGHGDNAERMEHGNQVQKAAPGSSGEKCVPRTTTGKG